MSFDPTQWLRRAEATAALEGPLNTTSLRPPETHEEWIRHYSWLHDAYQGAPYAVGDMKALGLFRAIDPDGTVIAETRRLMRDIQHVVDTDAQAIAPAGLTIDSADGDAPDTDRAWAVWRRSRVAQLMPRWARWECSMGDIGLEAVRFGPSDVRIVAYDPRHMRVEHDMETATEIERVVISIPYVDAPEIDAHGEARSAAVAHTYVRFIDADEIQVFVDGHLDEAQSGPHRAGVVPFVHIACQPYIDPEHGLWAAHGLEYSVAMVDSLLTQIAAIGERYGNPILAAVGVTVADGSKVSRMGRIASGIPIGGSLEMVESTLAQIGQLLAAATQQREMVRETLPEFLFTDTSASASGAALNYRASAFVAKATEMRSRNYDALARITQIAVEMESGTAHVGDEARYVVSAPPVLPVNRAEELEGIHEALDRGGMLRVDYVRHLQRLGIVGAEEDPIEYLAAVEAERAISRAEETGSIQSILGTGKETRQDEQVIPSAAETVADTAMNGAQVQAAQGIVESVASGALPRATGIEMLVLFFRLDRGAATQLMGDVGAGFAPAVDVPESVR